MHGQSTSRLGNLLTNVTLVEGIKVNFNVALYVLLPLHCFATIATTKAAVLISNNHGLEGSVQV